MVLDAFKNHINMVLNNCQANMCYFNTCLTTDQLFYILETAQMLLLVATLKPKIHRETVAVWI